MKTAKKIMTAVVLAVISFALCVAFVACGKTETTGGGQTNTGGGRPTQDVDPYVTAVSVTREPYKTEYLSGEKVDLDGLKFDATWMLDGEEEVIDMVAADLDGYTPGRNDALTTDVTKVECVIGGFTFEIAITVTEQQADTPAADEFAPLAISTKVSGDSTTDVKSDGSVYGTDIVYGHRIYDGSNLYEFAVDGKIDSSLRIQGGGLSGKRAESARTKVHYIFSNTGSANVAFRYYYEADGMSGSTTPTIRLRPGETTTIDFVVDTDKIEESVSPWVTLRLADNANNARLTIGAYEVCELEAGSYELALDGAEFADGTTEKLLAPGDPLPETALADEGKEVLGWYDVTDPGNRYPIGVDGEIAFTMPEDDVRLAPIVRLTEYASASLKPRKTSGGSVPEVYYADDTKTEAGKANYSTDGYTETKVLYTLYAADGDSDIVSGCGNHIGNNFDRDRVVKLTVTWKSGDTLSFRHWLDYEYNNEFVRAMTEDDITVGADNTTAVVYFIVTRDYVVNNVNGETSFHMQLLGDLTQETSFEMTCEYAYISE